MTHAPLDDVSHRPWPLPRRPWILAQQWHDLLFAHWPVPVAGLRPLVPPALELDTFDSEAWVGVVPFRMMGVRPRGVPAASWYSEFPELNVRTYVRVGDRAGVYFFSLDAASPVAVWTARRWAGLPYFHAEMNMAHERDAISYRSRRVDQSGVPAELVARYAPKGVPFRAERSSLDHWLTERYCLYTVDAQGARRVDVHHAPWPLQVADADFTRNTMALAAGIALPDTPPILHFAKRLDVVTWSPIRAVASGQSSES
jgi:uncharacterized protein YqjF (DUF2071 family)